jgi:hypothetical protein
MRYVVAIPAFLSSVILGAHFYRSGQIVIVGLCAAMAILAFVPFSPFRKMVQLGLLAGAIHLLWTTVEIAQRRAQMGEAATRMMIIMLGVSVWVILSAILLLLARKRTEM